MATFKFTIQDWPSVPPGPAGIDNGQTRQIIYGRAQVMPDTPGGSTSTYVAGGIRGVWFPLEPIKATHFVPAWVDMQSLTQGGSYVWTPGAVITSIAVASNVLTVTANNNFAVGDQVRLTGLTIPATTPAAKQLNRGLVRVVSATATSFTAQVAVPTLAATPQSNAIAIPIAYAPPGGGVPSSPPQGSVKIFTGGTELAAGSIGTTVTGDTIQFRAEFIRSWN